MTDKNDNNIDEVSASDAAKRKKWIAEYEKIAKEKEKKYKLLFKTLKKNLPELETYFNQIMRKEGVYEGEVYRFYHFSFKVYYLQETTNAIVELLQKINPNKDKKLCSMFEEIINDSKKIGNWKHEHNREWTKNTRPIVEAFFHAKYMLEMAVSCGKEYNECPKQMIDQKWASILELYNLR